MRTELHERGADDAADGLEALGLEVGRIVPDLVVVGVVARAVGEQRGDAALVERPVVGVALDAEGRERRGVRRGARGRGEIVDVRVPLAAAQRDLGLALPRHVEVQHRDDGRVGEREVRDERAAALETLLLGAEPHEHDGAGRPPAVVDQGLGERQQRRGARGVVVGAVEHAAGGVGAEVVEVRADEDHLVAQVRIAAADPADDVVPLHARVVLAVDLETHGHARAERAPRLALVARRLEVGQRAAALAEHAVGHGARDPHRRQLLAVELGLDRALHGLVALGDEEPDGAAVRGDGRLRADLPLERELAVARRGRAAEREDELALHVHAVVVVPRAVGGGDAVADEHDLGLDGARPGVVEVHELRAVLDGLALDLELDRRRDRRRREDERLEVRAAAVHGIEAQLGDLAHHPRLGAPTALEAGAAAEHRVVREGLGVRERGLAREPGEVVLGGLGRRVLRDGGARRDRGAAGRRARGRGGGACGGGSGGGRPL